MHGPIDYIIVGFEKLNFSGEILNELKAQEEKGIIKVLALALIAKDSGGAVTSVDVASLGDEAVVEFTQTLPSSDLVNEEDITEVGELLDNDTAAGLLIVEHLWAKGLKQAIINANGTLIAEGRIHPEAAEEIN